jgi:hypothetical protein
MHQSTVNSSEAALTNEKGFLERDIISIRKNLALAKDKISPAQ